MMPKRLILIAAMMAVLPLFCSAAKTREYYIAAEDVTWDYAPSGKDLMHVRKIPDPWGKQTQWRKTRYIEYTDATFSVRKPQPEWLGILGPVIRAEVDDTVIVHFLNRSARPHSVHPHGLRYDKDNEGAHYLPAGQGAAVPPGGSYTYRWLADKSSGPGADGPSSTVWWYHSHVEAEQEINAGLMGPIIVTAAGKADAAGKPKDVDRELIVLFMIFDEQHGKDEGLFHAINGFIFGNTPGLVMQQGENVRWYLLGMGNERDLHTPHWHGKTVEYQKRYTDVVELLPASMATVDMIADNPGTWMFHCHVLDHMEAGMMATYTIYSPPSSCPIQFVPTEHGQLDAAAGVQIRNTSNKPIRQVRMSSAYLVTPLQVDPFFGTWFTPQPLAPGQEQSVPVSNTMLESRNNVGWVFYPVRILYEDGTEWRPRQMGDCFHIYWRDQDHPEMPVLPPMQLPQKDND
jgi:hypothetical protein